MTVRMPGYCKTGTMLYSLTSQRKKGRRGKGGAAKGTKRQGHKKFTCSGCHLIILQHKSALMCNIEEIYH